MVSANIPEQWLTSATILRLSDRAYRQHCMLLTWAVSNRTNGHIPGDIPFLQIGITDDGMQEVAGAGLLEQDGDGWMLTEYANTQSSAEQIQSSLENLRAKSRASSRKYRDKKKSEQGDSTGRDITVTSPPESKEKQSKAKQDKALDDSSSTTAASEHEVQSWDVAEIPEGDGAGLDEVDMGTGELIEPEQFCERFGCSNEPLRGLSVCADHTDDRQRIEEARAEQLARLEEYERNAA